MWSNRDPREELRPVTLEGGHTSTSIDVNPTASAVPLAFDVYQAGEELCIDFDVPGVEPSAIRLYLEDRVLVVAVERELTITVDVLERGRAHGAFERRLLLPPQWGVDVLRASCANGVLHVRAPFTKPRAARAVEVETMTATRTQVAAPSRDEGVQHAVPVYADVESVA